MTLRDQEIRFQLLTGPIRVTRLLVVLLVAVFLGELIRPELLERAAVQPGEPASWKLLTFGFVHVSWFHLVVNAWSLWGLGNFLERSLGSILLGLLFGISQLIAGAAGALLSYSLVAGASGGVLGMLGCCVALSRFPGFLSPPMAALFWQRLRWPLVVNMVLSMLPGIATVVHVVGGLTGFLLGYGIAWDYRRERLKLGSHP